MSLLSRLFGARNPVDSMSPKDLRVMEIQLTRRIDEIAGEAKRVDAEIALLLEKARSPLSKNEEISLARRIKTLSQKKEMKLAAHAQLDKELRAVSNILIQRETLERVEFEALLDGVPEEEVFRERDAKAAARREQKTRDKDKKERVPQPQVVAPPVKPAHPEVT